MNRYKNYTEIMTVEGVKFRTGLNKEINYGGQQLFHKLRINEVGRLDIISYIYFKDPNWWWAIGQLNGIKLPYGVIDPIENTFTNTISHTVIKDLIVVMVPTDTVFSSIVISDNSNITIWSGDDPSQYNATYSYNNGILRVKFPSDIPGIYTVQYNILQSDQVYTNAEAESILQIPMDISVVESVLKAI